jgi:hypothetical protein
VNFSFDSFKTERVAELLGKAVGVVTSCRKPRALLRSIEREAPTTATPPGAIARVAVATYVAHAWESTRKWNNARSCHASHWR